MNALKKMKKSIFDSHFSIFASISAILFSYRFLENLRTPFPDKYKIAFAVIWPVDAKSNTKKDSGFDSVNDSPTRNSSALKTGMNPLMKQNK